MKKKGNIGKHAGVLMITMLLLVSVAAVTMNVYAGGENSLVVTYEDSIEDRVDIEVQDGDVDDDEEGWIQWLLNNIDRRSFVWLMKDHDELPDGKGDDYGVRFYASFLYDGIPGEPPYPTVHDIDLVGTVTYKFPDRDAETEIFHLNFHWVSYFLFFEIRYQPDEYIKCANEDCTELLYCDWVEYDLEYLEDGEKIRDINRKFTFGDGDNGGYYNGSGGGGGTCFLAGTQVIMDDDSLQNIEEIVVGDIVKAFDTVNDEILSAEVTETYHHSAEEMGDYYLVINDELCVTPNHPLSVFGTWDYADDVEVGDLLFGIPGSYLPVCSVERIYEQFPSYHLEIEPAPEEIDGGRFKVRRISFDSGRNLAYAVSGGSALSHSTKILPTPTQQSSAQSSSSMPVGR